MSDEGELAAATPAPSGDAQTDSAASAETILQAKENKLSFYLPIPDIEYIAKDAIEEYLLDEATLKDLPCREVDNRGKPYRDRFYKGADLQKAACERYGGEAAFTSELQTRARCYRCNPIDPPEIRYVVLSLSAAVFANIGANEVRLPIEKHLMEKMIQKYQESDLLCVLIHVASSRVFRSWGILTEMPADNYCPLELHETVTLHFRDIPRMYDDQDECFTLNGHELPPDLGHEIVKGCNEVVFDLHLEDTIKSKRRRSRSRSRDRSRRRSRSRDRRRDRSRSRDRSRRSKGGHSSRSRRSSRASRSKSPRPVDDVPPAGENSFAAALRKTRELSESKSALSNDPQRVIEKRKRQGFYI